MNKLGFLGIVNLVVIILVIVGAVVSYNFFKNGFAEDEKSEDDKELERDGDLEILEEEDLESEDSGENLEIE